MSDKTNEQPLLLPTFTTEDVKALTGEGGEFFSVEFHKRPKRLGKRALARGEVQPTKGELRKYDACRFGVKKDLKGGAPAYDRKEKNLLCVWVDKRSLKPEDAAKLPEGQNGAYRSIPCENVTRISAHSKKWEIRVEDGLLVEVVKA